ncbi:MAG: carbon starvation protein CstA [Lentisphaerae bacterium GWF2_45_14]|nr:MAG: carbon starvation protein CstA [Lentisphaerae bacterium GWF2_45_14]
MNSLVLAIGAGIFYLIAYYTYGRYLGRKIFKLNAENEAPSVKFEDNVDYVPSKKQVLFGHHFTSIAGTGPIVGPAIAIIWGWLPALIWVLLGSVFMGAVHDFGTLVVSMRNRGRSIGDVAGDMISPRAKLLFLFIIFFVLLIVIAIFGVVIGEVFRLYPESVFPVWFQIPIAITLGYFIYKKKASLFWPSIAAVALMYVTIVIGSWMPVYMPTFEAVGAGGTVLFKIEPVAIWVLLMLVYVYFASILPVNVLLQPRDYINSHQLFVALTLLALGIIVTRPEMVAPVVNWHPTGAPPMFPLIFVVIACGAISGFHSLVSSGTSSKQCDSEPNSLFIGYGSMLIEGMVAVIVIIACGAGVGLGLEDGGVLYKGADAFNHQYSSWGSVNSGGLGHNIKAFITGSSRMLEGIGIPPMISNTLMGVFIASFAATTLDTATRIQRYIITELSESFSSKLFTNKHAATSLAVGTAFLLAFHNGSSGKGALTLWPLFGCTNQLLGGLALLVITVYLAVKRCPIYVTLIPMLFMLVMTAWAMFNTIHGFIHAGNWLLLFVGAMISCLELWMLVESFFVLKRIFKNRNSVMVENN